MATKAKKSKLLSERFTLFDGANTLLMLLILFITLYPFWYCIIVSFNDSNDLLKGPLYFWPRAFSLDNYRFVFENPSLLSAFFVSVARTVVGMLLTVLFTGAAAYGLSKRDLIGRKYMMTYFIIPMYFGGGMIPTYLLIKGLGLLNNFLVYVIPSMWSFYYAILFMAFYDSIPESMEESAKIDGASVFTIFMRLILPVSMPIYATIALYCCVGQWNSWLDTVIYTKSESLVTLQYIMIKLVNEAEAQLELQKMMADTVTEMGVNAVSPTTVRVATMVVTTFPIVVVYPFFQKYFVKGIMLGSVKG
ncbi:MAG: carbohydrate ABC transporter permease [Ruminococcaceae bacterium]|nr:carbohydrate ABC transporter permease [Oscillospiraceae bacterium]